MSLTLFFIVEPPEYQNFACYLAASIRTHFKEDVTLVGYCPEHRMDELNPDAVEALRRMRCEVRPMKTQGRFDPEYPHGNKILACLEPRDTEFSAFVDSDVLMIRDNTIANLAKPGHVSCSVAASMVWAPQSIWHTIYGALGMEVPTERVHLMRQSADPVVPYFSSGFVIFPEGPVTPEGKSFAEVWMDTAQKIDAIEGLDKKRPYLDQMSLPLAIRRAGLAWNQLPEAQHYILGGKLRGKAFPFDEEIYTVHYRKWVILKETGLVKNAYDAMTAQVGVPKNKRIWRVPPPEGIAKVSKPA